MRKWLAALSVLCLSSAPAVAQSPCAAVSFESIDYTICTARAAKDEIRLFLNGRDGKPYGGFHGITKGLEPGKVLTFAMNAGMYHANLAPVGLYVEKSSEIGHLNLRSGPGNFHMRPNGVFYLDGKTAGVMEAERFGKSGIRPVYATQSGPMLVIDGKIHPKIRPSGTSAKFRNGVGVSGDGTVYFVISDETVTFHAIARLFRDRLKCANALYFDGTVSSLYAPTLGRDTDPFISLGPIVGVVAGKGRK